MPTPAPSRYWRRTLGLQVRYADCGGYRFCYAYRGKVGTRPSILMLHGFSAHKDAWLTVVKVHRRALLLNMQRRGEKNPSGKNGKNSGALATVWEASHSHVLSCFDPVSPKASAHLVCGHARPRGNNAHQHGRLLHPGTGQEDSSGELHAAEATKRAVIDFTEQQFVFLVLSLWKPYA